jgi:hypothetical protein
VKRPSSTGIRRISVEVEFRNPFLASGVETWQPQAQESGMPRYQFLLLNVVPGIICLLAGIVNVLSYHISFACVETIGRSHYQLCIGAGRIAIIRNSPWWRVEPFYGELDRADRELSPADWPGFHAKTRLGGRGFEYAEGDYKAAAARVREDTEFIPPFKPIEAGTYIWYSSKVRMLMAPLWFLTLIAGALPGLQLVARLRRRP